MVEADAGRRAALARLVRDGQRFAARPGADVAAFLAAAGAGPEGAAFALVETSWRMQPVPGGAGLARLLAGPGALRALAKEALREVCTASWRGASTRLLFF